MARYGLARHVFVCRDEEYVVVLDLKRDRYFSLEASRTAALCLVLPGWPAPAPENAPPDCAAEQAAAPLARQGWLLESSADSKHATPARPPAPEAELASTSDTESAKLDPGIVLAFVAASVFAKFALHFWRFERIIGRVARRKARRADPAHPFDLARARQLLEAFARMRVFLFSAQQECLHDSLAFVEFLARYGLFPNWVFGVRARPFAAHCWVQQAGVVFNDSVEHVSTYVPIMVV
jgi:Transglutaminase-like superfamily